MSEPKWTPGPYEARFTKDTAAIAQVGYMPHATVFNRAQAYTLLSEEDIANAHLFKAAPLLAEALREMLNEYHVANVPLTWEAAKKASAALAAARGET